MVSAKIHNLPPAVELARGFLVTPFKLSVSSSPDSSGLVTLPSAPVVLNVGVVDLRKGGMLVDTSRFGMTRPPKGLLGLMTMLPL